jgi:hypothetical protein
MQIRDARSGAMKRFRLSTLMLVIVIAALCVGLAVQLERASRREAELQARLVLSWPLYVKQQMQEEQIKLEIEARNQRRLQTLAKQREANAEQPQ